MKTTITGKSKAKVISQMIGDSLFQVLEYNNLRGIDDLKSAISIRKLYDEGITLKQIKIILRNSAVKIQDDIFSYMKGDVYVKHDNGGPVSFGKKLLLSKVTGENIDMPILKGTGEVFLESSFKYFILIELDDEEIIVNKDIFFACENSVKTDVIIQKSVSSMIIGEEGILQLKLYGKGIVVLNLPVPEEEIIRYKLFNDTLTVDGDFVVLRTGSVDFSVEKSGSKAVGSELDGECLINSYEGIGEVWLLPTLNSYQLINDILDDEKDDSLDDLE